MAASALGRADPNYSSSQVRSSSIGYPSVTAALDALRARKDVTISEQQGWTIVNDPASMTLWSFVPKDNPAYPAAVKRAFVQKGAEVYVNMNVLCQAEQTPCDKLVEDFNVLNQQMREDFERNQAPQPVAPADGPPPAASGHP